MSLKVLPHSIYSRTMVLVGVVTFLLQVTTLVIFFNQMVFPNVQLQVDDFVVELLEFASPENNLRTTSRHQFVKETEALALQPAGWRIPFWYLVEEALVEQTGRPVVIWKEVDTPPGQGRYWIDFIDPERTAKMRVGFSSVREGCLDPPVLLLVLFLVVATSVTSVYFLSRWLVRPIDELQAAVLELGMGEYPLPLPVHGPTEFSTLVRRFNWMVKSVQELTENRSAFLAGISHDLKTPLARMRLSVEMLNAESERDLVNGVVEDLDVMDNLISKAMEYARGEHEVNPVEVDLVELLDGVVERKKRGGVILRWVRPSFSCVRVVDATALQRILSNYIDNASRYGGTEVVELVLQCIQGRVEIAVHDHGPGMPEQDLSRAFQPFYRIDPSRSEQGGGSGLGLAIVKNLASMNGWQVLLRNRPEGGLSAIVRMK